MNWMLWGILLLVQNFSFTIVSRARNSKSLAYHAIASVFSNSIWFASQFIIIDSISKVIKTADLVLGIKLGLFYTCFTMIGSLSSHWMAMKFWEGK